MPDRDSYTQQLRSLMPPGPAWASGPGTTFLQLLVAFAEELVRTHQKVLALIEESDPRTTIELLENYETVYGLPEPCIQIPDTVAQRQRALAEKWTRHGLATPQYYQDLVRSLGFPRAIVEEFYDSTNLYKWRINIITGDAAYWKVNEVVGEPILSFNVDNTYIQWWTTIDEVNKPLRQWYLEFLLCVMNKVKPAHTHFEHRFSVIYDFQEEAIEIV